MFSNLAAITAPIITLLALAGIVIFIMSRLRVVVPSNEVHIVQSGGQSRRYGRSDDTTGSVYYKWPSWVPKFGVVVSVLPLSVFKQHLHEYAGYDTGRVPFLVDVVAFFRIDNPVLAAERVSSFDELEEQLTAILQGSVRTILAQQDIEHILEARATFSAQFTEEVSQQLRNWGITTAKMIELMDIKDAQGSKVIENIMQKKKSLIERESRVVVAENQRAAEQSEIEARRAIDLAKQEAVQQTGIRQANVRQEVGLAEQRSMQAVAVEEAATTQKQMDVENTKRTRLAEIQRSEATIQAKSRAEQASIDAEARVAVAKRDAEQATTRAEGELQVARHNAAAAQAAGEAAAAAERARLLASVVAQVELAEKIGGNEGYQKYLLTQDQIRATAEVGKAQAEALKEADIKVIVTGHSAQEGIGGVAELLSGAGGAKIGVAFETAQAVSPAVAAIAGKVLDIVK